MQNKIFPAVIGLGYVGLPIYLNLQKKINTVGFDIDKEKILNLKKKIDTNNQFKKKEFFRHKINNFISNYLQLKKCNFFIITVPTPIFKNKKPDLGPLLNATKIIGKIIKNGDIVVYESTVYPGVTNSICVPLIEKISKLTNKINFSVVYSPERINPGDRKHSINKITKVIALENYKIKKRVSFIYKNLTNKLFFTNNIEDAETSKVFENIQRDVNISLMNELYIICKKLNLNYENVIKIAKTKWNFLSFNPGLVGGHCLPVDPYYLSYIAKKNKINTKLIIAGRKTNDLMEKILYKKITSYLKEKKIKYNDKILICGLTYKPEVADLRNSIAYSIFIKIRKKFKNCSGFDPLIHNNEVKKFSILNKVNNYKKYKIIIFITKHKILIKIYKKLIINNKKIILNCML
jgi:UDP-N-acetyl-D-glucosamine/UDP-N-acetyl-D-galactosamine dehydrogenase